MPTIFVHDTEINFKPTGRDGDWKIARAKMFDRAKRLRGLLRRRGWTLTPSDREQRRRWRKYSRTHHGRFGDLELHMRVDSVAIKMTFYQTLADSNPHGGHYDFDRFCRMTPLLRHRYAVEGAAVICAFFAFGGQLAEHRKQPRYEGNGHLARWLMRVGDVQRSWVHGDPLASFNMSWGADRFERDETGWPAAATCRGYGGPKTTTDGVPLRNGLECYTRIGGRWHRGRIFGGINGSWYFVVPGRFYCNHWGPFCAHPDLEARPRRVVEGQPKRLRQELVDATKAANWGRVAAIAAVLDRGARSVAA